MTPASHTCLLSCPLIGGVQSNILVSWIRRLPNFEDRHQLTSVYIYSGQFTGGCSVSSFRLLNIPDPMTFVSEPTGIHTLRYMKSVSEVQVTVSCWRRRRRIEYITVPTYAFFLSSGRIHPHRKLSKGDIDLDERHIPNWSWRLTPFGLPFKRSNLPHGISPGEDTCVTVFPFIFIFHSISWCGFKHSRSHAALIL